MPDYPQGVDEEETHQNRSGHDTPVDLDTAIEWMYQLRSALEVAHLHKKVILEDKAELIETIVKLTAEVNNLKSALNTKSIATTNGGGRTNAGIDKQEHMNLLSLYRELQQTIAVKERAVAELATSNENFSKVLDGKSSAVMEQITTLVFESRNQTALLALTQENRNLKAEVWKQMRQKTVFSNSHRESLALADHAADRLVVATERNRALEKQLLGAKTRVKLLEAENQGYERKYGRMAPIAENAWSHHPGMAEVVGIETNMRGARARSDTPTSFTNPAGSAAHDTSTIPFHTRGTPTSFTNSASPAAPDSSTIPFHTSGTPYSQYRGECNFCGRECCAGGDSCIYRKEFM